MTPVLLLPAYDAGDDAEPHADLVAAQRPTPAQVMTAAGILGGFPPGSYLGGEVQVTQP